MSNPDVKHTIAELVRAGESLRSEATFIGEMAGELWSGAPPDELEHAAEGLRAYAGRVVQLAFTVADGAGKLAGVAAAALATEAEVQS